MSGLTLDVGKFALAALVLAALGLAFVRPLRRAMVALAVMIIVGEVLANLAGWVASPHQPLYVIVHELGLLLVGIGGTRVVLLIVLIGVLRRARLPLVVGEVLLALVLVVYAIYRMQVLGVNLAGIVTTSAVVTAVLAFSLNQTLGNLWGGIALQLDGTCRMGDWIRVDRTWGQVVGIRWRYLALATNDGETVIIPNGELMKQKVEVLGRRGDELTGWRRRVSFEVAFAAPAPRVVAAIDESLARADLPWVARAPRPYCVVDKVADDGIMYAVYYWLADPAHDVAADSRVMMHCLAALERAGMEVPYQHRVIVTAGDIAQGRASTEKEQLAARRKLLSQLPLFEAFMPEELDEIAANLADAHFAGGELLWRQDEQSDSLILLARGTVGVYRESATGDDGTRTLLRKLEAPAYFGEMGLLTGQPRMATVMAEGDTLCYRLSRAGFDHVLRARPAIADALSTVVASRHAQNVVVLQAQDAARARPPARATEIARRIREFFELR
jgi:small-conductance mechanosensitive channel/CRP-like cAMP-binding protein